MESGHGNLGCEHPSMSLRAIRFERRRGNLDELTVILSEANEYQGGAGQSIFNSNLY